MKVDSLLIEPEGSSSVPELLSEKVFQNVHPVVKALFTQEIPKAGLAGRLRFFIQDWRKVTSDPAILEIVRGYKIPFSHFPKQGKVLENLVKGKEALVEEEIHSMLGKGAIKRVQHARPQFLSNLFLVSVL